MSLSKFQDNDRNIRNSHKKIPERCNAPTPMLTSAGLPVLVTLDRIEGCMKDSPTFRSDLLRGLLDGFAAYERGEFCAAPIQTLGAPPLKPFAAATAAAAATTEYAAQTCVKSGYFVGEDHYVVKVASGGHPFPSNSGHLQVYSQATGKLLALLLDDGLLTEVRTAAVGALVARTVGPKTIRSVGMVGTGVQARYQLRFLAETLPTDGTVVSLFLYGRSSQKVEILKYDLIRDLPNSWAGDISIVEHPDDLLERCDVIVTTTSAREALLGTTERGLEKDVRRTKLITCIGADAPGKQELSDALIDAADVLVADSLVQTQERGEFQRYCNAKGGTGGIVPLGRKLSEEEVANNECGLVIFDSSGVALQDCVIAKMVYKAVTATTSG